MAAVRGKMAVGMMRGGRALAAVALLSLALALLVFVTGILFSSVQYWDRWQYVVDTCTNACC